jgi:hypothetical protein
VTNNELEGRVISSRSGYFSGEALDQREIRSLFAAFIGNDRTAELKKGIYSRRQEAGGRRQGFEFLLPASWALLWSKQQQNCQH